MRFCRKFVNLKIVERFIILIGCAYIFSSSVVADVDKVYHPYVDANTYEVESRIISRLDSGLFTDLSVYRFGVGKSITDNFFAEIYLIGRKNSEQKIEFETYEIEALYQFTEQGEYDLDVALLVEIGRNSELNEWEGNFALVLEKEFSRWSATLNLHNRFLVVDEQHHDWEYSQTFQLRYRYSFDIEPGIEIYADNNEQFVGPVFLGKIKLIDNVFNWEVGVVKNINQSKNGTILRVLFEYEF